MQGYPHPIIAREGWGHIALSVVVAVLVTAYAGWVWGTLCWLIVVFVLQFFRDPPRQAPAGERAILSPADGRVVVVERAIDPYLKRDALKLSVFMNVFNAHSNRSPADGEVREVWYSAGTFVNASIAKASSENERNALWIRLLSGADLVCVQVAGLVARRILCYVKAGDRLQRGQRYGFIRFGSRLDVYLPTMAQPKVSVGDRVYAGSSIIAMLD